MAQIKGFNYKGDDSTFEINRRLIGILGAGRYRGFEADTFQNDMILRLVHTTGHLHIEKNLTSQNCGLLLTKQGTAIRETEALNLTIDPNTHSSSFRIDLVVCEHNYVEVDGGSTALYKIIKGSYASVSTGTTSQVGTANEGGAVGGGFSGGGPVTSNEPEEPSLDAPNKQIIVGRLYVPAQTTLLTKGGVKYFPAEIPQLGDSRIVFDKIESVQDDLEKLLSDYSFFSLNDVIFNNVSDGKIMYYDAVSRKFQFRGLATWIQDTKLKFDGGKSRLEGNSRTITAQKNLTFEQDGSGGGNLTVFDIGSTANVLFFDYDMATISHQYDEPVDTMDYTAAPIEVGSELKVCFLPNSSKFGFRIEATQAYAGKKIFKSGVAADDIWTPYNGVTFSLLKRPDGWEIIAPHSSGVVASSVTQNAGGNTNTTEPQFTSE